MKRIIPSILLLSLFMSGQTLADVDSKTNESVYTICCCSKFYESLANRAAMDKDQALYEKMSYAYALVETLLERLDLNANDVAAKKYICFENMKTDIDNAGGAMSVVLAKYAPLCGEISRRVQDGLLKELKAK